MWCYTHRFNFYMMNSETESLVPQIPVFERNVQPRRKIWSFFFLIQNVTIGLPKHVVCETYIPYFHKLRSLIFSINIGIIQVTILKHNLTDTMKSIVKDICYTIYILIKYMYNEEILIVLLFPLERMIISIILIQYIERHVKITCLCT